MLKLFKRRSTKPMSDVRAGSAHVEFNDVDEQLDGTITRGFDAVWNSLPAAERRRLDRNMAHVFYELGVCDGVVYAQEGITVSERNCGRRPPTARQER